MVHLTAPDHAKAVNLARRFTAQNENDLMQESVFDDDEVHAVKPGKPDHANAVNLARRFTAQNENDLMQESMLDDPDDNVVVAPKKEYNKDICEELAHHTVHSKYMPKECNKYSDAVQQAKSHDKDRTDPSQLLS